MTRIRFPFSLSDEVLHFFDHPHEPQTVHLEIRIAGSLERDRLVEAVAAALLVHPMARACQVARRQLVWPPQWEVSDLSDLEPGAVVRTISFRSQDELNDTRSRFYSLPISIRRAPPLRILHVECSDGDYLMLSVNHAVCDGIGALRFLRSVAKAYDCHPDLIPHIDPIAARDLRPLLAETPVPQTPPPDGREKLNWRATDVLAGSNHAHESGYGFHFRIVRMDGRFRPDKRWQTPEATFNDALLAALHRAIGRWNALKGHPCEYVSVMMPVNLRRRPWHDELVGNFLRSGKVVSSAPQRENPQDLLTTVAVQTRYIKQGGAATFLRAPRWSHRFLPLLLPLLRVPIVLPRHSPAAVLTNFGKLDSGPHFGIDGGETVELWAAAPTSMPGGLSVGTATLHDRLHVALRYRRALFDDSAAQAFASIFEEELTLICGSSTLNSRAQRAG